MANFPQLKPQMESIFAEVAKCLPSIDNLSDIESDSEEPEIFHRNINSMCYLSDDDKDLDTSLGEESPNKSNLFTDKNEISDNLPYDNDLAFLKNKTDHKKNGQRSFKMCPDGDRIEQCFTSSWADLEKDYQRDKSHKPPQLKPPQFQNWVQSKNMETAAHAVEVSTQMDEDFFMDIKEMEESLLENQGKESVTSMDYHSHSADSYNFDKYSKMLRKSQNDKLRKQEKEMASQFISPTAPTLSFDVLEQIDIDILLETLTENNQYGPRAQQAWFDESVPIPDKLDRGDCHSSANTDLHDGTTLIEKLAKLSVSQGADNLHIDPFTGAMVCERIENVSSKWKTGIKDAELIKPKAVSMGTNTSDLPQSPPIKRSAAMSSARDVEHDTVFIDLRDFEKHKREEQQSIERVQRILRIRPESFDSSDSEDDDTWEEQRKRMKEGLTSKGVSTDSLPPKPKISRVSDIKKPKRVINLSKKSAATESSVTVGEATEAFLTEEDILEAQIEVAKRIEKERQMETARKLQQQREKERESRLRLAKRIEVVQPTASVSGRHNCAEAIPVIYDLEASYEPAPRTLPAVISPDQECLLLTINLSSNGEIVLHRNKTNKSVDTGCGLTASYTTLLTWLFSLVPNNFSFLQKQSEDVEMFPPFYVIGLQQMWLDEQLCLAVAVTPTEQFAAKFVPVKSKKSKVRDEVKGSSRFMQLLTKYLSTNNLHNVCPWLEGLVSMEVTSKNEKSTTPSYSYAPPLPNITTKPLSTFIHVNPDPAGAKKVFNTAVGFFWQTVDSDDGYYEIDAKDDKVNYETQNTMSLIYKKIFLDPEALMGILNRVLQEGLDLAGVRLLYPTPELLGVKAVDNSERESEMDLLNNIGPVLAIAIRGTFARSIWLDAVGPADPALARRTDPNSLCAQFGGSSRDECLFFTPRNASRIHTELSTWFGGRVPPGGAIDVGTPYTRKDHLRSGSPKGRRGKKVAFADSQHKDNVLLPHRPPATLTATTKSNIFLVMSPIVPPKCFGLLMATCQRRGYQVRGIKRLKLTTKRAGSLGIATSEITTFCPGICSEVSEQQQQGRNLEASLPCTVFILEKENSSHNAASLIESFMIQMTLQGVLNGVQQYADYPVTSRHLFHAATFSDGLLNVLGGDFNKCPDYELQPGYLQPTIHTNPELEQVSVLLLLGHDILKSCGLFLGKILNLVPHSKTPVVSPFTDSIELLGLKWLPALKKSQAKEVTPFEVGDGPWKESIKVLTSEPVMVLALRGVNIYNQLSVLVPNRESELSSRGRAKHLDKLMSQTVDEAYTYVRLFFTAHDLFGDPASRPLLPYLPDSTLYDSLIKENGSGEPMVGMLQHYSKENILDEIQSGPQPITTVLVVKPSAVRKHLAKIMKKLKQEDFRVVGLHLQVLDKMSASVLLPREVTESDESEFCDKHINHLTSSASLCLCLQRENAIKKLVDLLGPSDPQSARRHSQFLWRGVFGSDPVANGLHSSANYKKAIYEQKLFFPDGLCCEETENLKSEEITCPAVDSKIDVMFYENREIQLTHKPQIPSGVNSTQDVHDLLLQTTCLVLSPELALGSSRDRKPGYADILEILLSHSFELCAARMVCFTKSQAETFLHIMDAGHFKHVPLLMSGPSLVLVLQRDNAVLAFDTILAGNLSSDEVLKQCRDQIFKPSTIQQSHRLTAFFFDELLPGSQLSIMSKHSNKMEGLCDHTN